LADSTTPGGGVGFGGVGFGGVGFGGVGFGGVGLTVGDTVTGGTVADAGAVVDTADDPAAVGAPDGDFSGEQAARTPTAQTSAAYRETFMNAPPQA
jgi:hypothetical protein